MPSELVCNSAALRRFPSIQAAEFKNNSALPKQKGLEIEAALGRDGGVARDHGPSLVELPVPPDDVIGADASRFMPARESESQRDAKFAVRVLPAYDYTCALTQYRMIALNGKTALDAAHIHQLTQGGSNHPTNGIALSKTAHWLFDQGFWSISNDYKILVAEDRFDERGDAAHLLKPRAGNSILSPQNQHYLPDRESLTWHRQHHGFE
jgi:putative restriction endonuclease